jgi:hypothetical protein
MSELPTYSFLPWLRPGVANAIRSGDGDTGVLLRATLGVELTVKAEKTDGTTATETVTKDVQLYGPGDVVGIDPRSIVKVEPRHWITNYEPNYLPYVDFYDEDFPWRYTPAKTEGQRLRPWIALVVLKTSEFDDQSKGDDQPLPSIKLKAGTDATALFPDPTQLWAWAHVHVNRDLGSGSDVSNATVTANLTAMLAQNPDLAYSRLLSPRKLEPNSAYHAFLIPVFESGRLAGLKRAVPATTVATASAWDSHQVDFPYYFRWYFRTGAKGDFEYLVDQLVPRPTDKRVGVRDLDVLHPGSNLPPIQEPKDLGGVLALGGALKVPFATLAKADQDEVKAYDLWDENPYPHPFEEKLADLVNMADEYSKKNPLDVNRENELAGDYQDDDPDPIITLPLYARWHALTDRLLEDASGAALPNTKNWVHEVNLDPRFRVAAGLGTRVVQDKQEEFMDAAWQQVGDIIEANRKIRQAELAHAASSFYYSKHLTNLPLTRLMAVTAPVNRRVIVKGVTLHHAREKAVVAPVVTSTVFRKLTRPTGTIAKRIDRTARRLAPTSGTPRLLRQAPWVEKINEGALRLAPPKVTPSKIATVNKAADSVKPGGVAGALYELATIGWVRWLVLALALVLITLGALAGAALLAGLGGVAAVAFYFLTRAANAVPVVEFLAEKNQTEAAVDALPASPGFRISPPGSAFVPSPGATDSAEAARFKQGLKDSLFVSSISYAAEPRAALDLGTTRKRLLEQLHPDFSIPRRMQEIVRIPERIRDAQVDSGLRAVMAYPEIDVPMYLPLSKLSTELFLPNLQLIPENSISLLEPNQKFIEAYMAGVNHEMSRELLWREYPTDQRGSIFRQFWDVSGCYPGVPPPADVRERMRDIPPLHQWTPESELGTHNQRMLLGDKAQLVLVIRGELLKRYPTAVIYARRAEWQQTNGINDPAKERVLTPLSEAENDNPPADKVKTPLFEAKIEPDIYFFGFDLSAEETRGGTTASEPPGWFFVIKERPGEPRFGLDEPADGQLPRLINWNDLSWNAIGTAAGSCIAINQLLTFDVYDPNVDQENTPIASDAQAQWGPDTNAAMLAYILNQVPVMVAVHAARMLPEQTP